MHAPARRSALVALALATAPIWPGCTAKKQTEYVAGVSTQVQVPRDLRAIRVGVSVEGFTVFCRSYRAYNGIVQLPRSLGTYAANDDPKIAGSVTYTIIGYSSDLPADEEFGLEGCQDSKVNDSYDTRIIRRSRQPYIPEKILFLPLPLKYSCFDKTDCDDPEKTCKAGRCVPADTPPETLPEYSPDLIDGRGGACFSVTQCLGAAKPAVVVDAETCTYAIANTASEPPRLEGAPDLIPGDPLGEGVNVLISYDGGLNQEVLDKDPDEGFIIPDPAFPQRFRLAPGLCDLVKGIDGETGATTRHRITAIRASETCRAKSKFQPICADDQLALMGGAELGGSNSSLSPPACAAQELVPPDSSLVVVVDNTKSHEGFFDKAESEAVQISLDDPAFARTKLALVYAPGTLACSAGAPDITLGPSRQVKGQIVQSFGQYAPGTRALELSDGPTAFEGALTRAYAVAAEPADDFKRAVLVFGNRDFNPPDAADQCIASPGSPATLAQDAKANGKIDTYVVMLVNTPGDDLAGADALAQADALSLAGGTAASIDARSASDKGKALELFQDLVASLATCVYDVRDGSQPPEDGVLSYLDPLFGQKFTIAPGTCANEGAPGQGWGYGADPKPGTKRIFLCQESCDQYRGVLKGASAFNLTFGQAAPAVPIFAHKAGCGPTP